MVAAVFSPTARYVEERDCRARRPGGARTGLSDGSVPVNADGAWLQNIAGETYVVAPACFEAFAAGWDLAAATVRNRVVRLHALTARAGADRFRPGRSPRDEPCARTRVRSPQAGHPDGP